MKVREFQTVWEQRAGRIGPEMELALRTAAPLIQAVSRFQMNRLIYSKPPDIDASGKPKWVQTRNLYNAEIAEAEPSRRRIVLVNRMIYARARHELGRDGRKTNRVAHWREEAREAMQQQFVAQLRAANLKTLSGGRLAGVLMPPAVQQQGGGGGGGGGGQPPQAPVQRGSKRRKLRFIPLNRR